MYTRNGTEAIQQRHNIISPGSGIEHWGTEYFGPRFPTETGVGPQSLMTELTANETVLAHFHGVSQFQIFAIGSGTMGRNQLQPITFQFKDPSTAYGPVIAGPQGLSFFVMRIKTAHAAPVYLDRPGYKEFLKPSKRRNLIIPSIMVSTEPVLMYRKEAYWDPIIAHDKYDDGLAAHVLRMGAGMEVMGPDPRRSGGYYLFVINGSLEHEGKDFPLWSMIVVERHEDAVRIKAGKKGVEVMVLEFPIQEAETQETGTQ